MSKLGVTSIVKVYLGETEIAKAYLGEELVYDNSNDTSSEETQE